MKSFLKRNLIFTIQPIVTRFITFVVLPIYTLKISPSDFGVLEVILTIGIFFKTVVSMSTTTSFWKFTNNKYGEEYKTIVFNIILIPLLLSLGLFPILILVALFFLKEINLYLIVLYCLSEVFLSIFNIANLVIRNHANARAFIYITSLYIFSFISLTYLTVVHLDLGITGVIYTYFLSATVCLIFSYFYVLRNFINITAKFHFIKEVIKYSYPLTFSNLLFILMGFSDRFFLLNSSGQYQLGLYSYYSKISSLIRVFFVDTFFSLWNPIRWKIYHHPWGKDIFYNVFISFRLLSLLGPIPLYLFLSRFTIVFTQNHEYLSDLGLIGVLCVGSLLYALYFLSISGLLFTSKTKYISYVVSLSLIFNLICNSFFVDTFGMLATSVINTLTYGFLAFSSHIISKKYYKIPVSLTFDLFYYIIVILNVCVLTYSHLLAEDLGVLLAAEVIFISLCLIFYKFKVFKINYTFLKKLNEIR